MPSGISAAIRRGLIEAGAECEAPRSLSTISAAIRRGLIEATKAWYDRGVSFLRFPRPFAAASLKQQVGLGRIQRHVDAISAAIRRGLIEADYAYETLIRRNRFPRPFAAASLKPAPERERPLALPADFRGHSPRPH